MAADLSISPPSPDAVVIVRAVTAIIGTVVGLTFLFGFGNVLNLALRLRVPVWVAPLVAPVVDLSVIGLLLGTRHLALAGASPAVLRPVWRLPIFASVVTLALNVADSLVAGEYGWRHSTRLGLCCWSGGLKWVPAFCRRSVKAGLRVMWTSWSLLGVSMSTLRRTWLSTARSNGRRRDLAAG